MSVPVRSIAPPAPQRLAGCLALSALAVALLAGCAGPSTKAQRPAGRVVTADIEQWKEHISEASRRFDIPEEWIRAVMRVESGGRSTMDGRPIVSRAGAMGLMQVMPGTYEDLRARHGLGSDPYNPRDNILAGTAYLREMYDMFGAPGFLGAYNCGPACYADYMAGSRRLPSETRNYIAMISPALTTARPNRPGPTVYAAAAMPPPPRLPNPPPAAPASTGASVPPVQVAALPPQQPVAPAAPARPSYTASPYAASPYAASTPAYAPGAASRYAAAPPVPPSAVPVQVAAALPVRAFPVALPTTGLSGQWAIQVGAFSSADVGERALERAVQTLPDIAGPARRQVVGVDTAVGRLYRARLVGLSPEAAGQACERLARGGGSCVTLPPDRVY